MAEQELLDTIEEIRQKKFGDLPADLVKEIVLIESNFTDNRQEACKWISAGIDAHLEKLSGAKQTGV